MKTSSDYEGAVAIRRESDQNPHCYQHHSDPNEPVRAFAVERYSVGLVEGKPGSGKAFIYATEDRSKPGVVLSSTIQIGHADLPDVIEALQLMLYKLNGG